MNRVFALPAALAVLIIFAAAAASAQQPATSEPEPVLCPVTKRPVDWHQVARFRNKWVYFADAAALHRFNEEPFEYAAGVLEQWKANQPIRMQVKCPVSGEPVDLRIYVGEGLDAVYFATREAREKWLADNKPYQQRLEKECFTFQTLCAHSGRPIDPRVSATIDGRTLYFFCPNCRAAFGQENDAEQARLLKLVDEQIKRHKRQWQARRAGSVRGTEPLERLQSSQAELRKLLAELDAKLDNVQRRIAARRQERTPQDDDELIRELGSTITRLQEARTRIELTLLNVEQELAALLKQKQQSASGDHPVKVSE